MKPITIKDIARELGISVSTVSRALQNHPDISEQTKVLVRECARKLNYKPNVLASNLRTNKNTTIGVVIPELHHHFFSSVLDGIEQAANDAGYTIVICQTGENAEKEIKGVHTLISSRVAGMLVGISKETTNYHHLHEVIANGIPLVLYDRPCPSLPCDEVISDDYAGAFSAVEYLIQTGCKRIICLASSSQLEVSRRRLQGWRDALQRYDMVADPSAIVECDTREKAIIAAPSILQGENRPDGIFCVNDDCAAGIVHVAKILGIAIPDQLSVCGFSDAPLCRATHPMLTTVQQHGAEIGKRAFARLLKRINGDTKIHQTEMVSTDLIVRETTR